MDDGNLPGKILEPHPDDIAVPQQDFSFVRLQVFSHQIEQRTLAAAVGPDEGGDFPLVKLQVEVLQHLLFAVGEGKVFDGKHVIVHSFASTSSTTG